MNRKKIARAMMHLCIECGAPADQMETGRYYRHCAKCRELIREQQLGTLCWKCINAVPKGRRGCSWSRYRLPVDGWTAKPTRFKKSEDAYTDSYFVTACPEFREDKDED